MAIEQITTGVSISSPLASLSLSSYEKYACWQPGNISICFHVSITD